ncbi:hypothetical protein CHCC20348_4182 [Bacillus paralicheniformis]|nr:hypothetical protein CHCC20348_4182 [Bacillus paralicheniformis]
MAQNERHLHTLSKSIPAHFIQSSLKKRNFLSLFPSIY